MTLSFPAYVVIDPEGRVLIDTRDFATEEDAWRIVLGWPDGSEIERAKKEGYRVVRADVKVQI